MEKQWDKQKFVLLFLKLQEARFDLWLSILQRGGGQRGIGRQVGHRGRHLRDAAGQLLPGQQGGRRGAVTTGGVELCHIHGGTAGHRDRGGRLQRGSVTRVFGLTELSLWLHFQGGSEVEAERQDGRSFLCWSIKPKAKMGKGYIFWLWTCVALT